jgi:hypothetical protein
MGSLKTHSLSDCNGSEFQACREVKSVTCDPIADVEVVNPARTEIEVALTQVGGVGNDGADAEKRFPNSKASRDRFRSHNWL